MLKTKSETYFLSCHNPISITSANIGDRDFNPPGLQSSSDFANKLAMKSYLLALLININVPCFVKSCNEFGDFCDTGDGEFPELESDQNSLATIMDRRMRTRHGTIFFKMRTCLFLRNCLFTVICIVNDVFLQEHILLIKVF